MRKLVAAAVLALVACSGHPDVKPQCHAGVAHYYAAGCAIAPLDEADAEQQCIEYGNGEPDGCRDGFTELMACLNAASSSASCVCDQQWEDNLNLCD